MQGQKSFFHYIFFNVIQKTL